ncbi:MAG: transglycosylase domain-containing protein [Candidatus Beckwithbacteria bacterium]|nr:transglycosylase domain-containing protein [Candidatus Beckwithbacteria bacterium]
MFKVLEIIGRFTYRSIFWLIKLIFQSVVIFISAYKSTFRFLKSLKITVKLPTINLPRIKIPYRKLPHPKLPRLKTLKIKLKFKKIPVVIFLFILSGLFYWFVLKGLPNPTDLINHPPAISTKIYDRNGQLLFTFYKDQNRTLIPLSDIPQHFKQATLAIEDSHFYTHKGVSWTGILRSLEQIIFNRQLQGGSTITQQLVKNALLTPERTLTRKLKELILTIETEVIFSKDEILEMYFNQVSYGGTAYGAEQAAQTYFGQSIKDVDLAEAALLAGLPAAPTTYSPFGSNPYLAIYRQHEVLNRMVEEKMIAPQEAELAKAEKIKLAPQYSNIKAPHFVMYIKDLLVSEYGESMVEQGGLSVTTSLDLTLQEKAQSILTQEIDSLSPFHITNGAALVTNPQTGEILAMIGSRNYFDFDHDGQVNLTTALRQPGSSIKPVNYAYALEHGYTAASIIQDTPVTYNIPGTQPYSPINYDGTFHGPITLRYALANSVNVPAVKVLASYGVDKMIEEGKKMGITTWNQPERYGLSLTLGGAEIKMVDMAVVYGTLANQGLKVNLHPILKITDAKGKILQDFDCQDFPKIMPQAEATTKHLTCNPEPVLNSLTAYILTDILADPFARAQAFGLRSYLNVPGQQVAVKTGTTNDKRDNWTIGYTTNYLVATWVGNNDNTPMSQVASGITGASPIWNKIFTAILQNQPAHQFTPPANLIKANICTITGQLTCEGCPTKTEYFIPGTEPKQACSPDQIKIILEEKAKKDQEERDKLLTGASTQR